MDASLFDDGGCLALFVDRVTGEVERMRETFSGDLRLMAVADDADAIEQQTKAAVQLPF
ncbi:hypothetical protein D3C78_1597230 [compost metagenome]